MRDLTEKQFLARLDKYGMELEHFGYVRINKTRRVYRFNAGNRLRAQLAYLIEQQKKAEREATL